MQNKNYQQIYKKLDRKNNLKNDELENFNQRNLNSPCGLLGFGYNLMEFEESPEKNNFKYDTL